jgi:transposase
MEGYPMPAVERAMKVQTVILKAMSGQFQWWQAAEILGVSCRTMRRWKHKYEQYGDDGLFDRRRRHSPRRVPVAHLGRQSSKIHLIPFESKRRSRISRIAPQ